MNHALKSVVVFMMMAVVVQAQDKKLSREEFLTTKVTDAAMMCRSQIEATAKDPTTLQFADKYSYGFGHALTRNWIFISWDIMGKNTYGALLRHQITCTVSCTQDKPCKWISMEDR